MAFYDKFPYTNYQELNLDKILQDVGDVQRAEESAKTSADAAAASEHQARFAAVSATDHANAAIDAETEAKAAANQVKESVIQIETNKSNIQALTGQMNVLSAEVSETAEQCDTNTTRIDNILVQGTPTEGNAELIDIRVGADGVTYPMAGDATRGQFLIAHKEINNTNEYSKTIRQNLESITEINIVSLSQSHWGYYLNTSGNPTQSSGTTFTYTTPIRVYSKYTYVMRLKGTPTMAAIVKCDSAGNNRSAISTYTANAVENFSYKPSVDGYMMVSFELDRNANKAYPTWLCYGESLEDRINDTIDAVTETRANLFNMSQIQIGKNWQNSDASNRAIVNANVYPNRQYYLTIPADTSGGIINVSVIEKTNVLSAQALRSTTLDNGTTWTFTTTADTNIVTLQFNGRRDLVNADFTGYTPYLAETPILSAVDNVARSELRNVSYWRNKRIVWLGTSIPAAGKYQTSNPNSYPFKVGKLLDCNVINEAVGSSGLHCKKPELISDYNPYGFEGNFEAVSRCLTNSLAEMNWIINHYNDTRVFTSNVPDTLTNADKDFIRSCSWELKLGRYFNEQSFPDAWIIDHGHNDLPTAASEATYTEKQEMEGTVNSGYYQGGVHYDSDTSSYLEFNVTNNIYTFISGTLTQGYDYIDLYDADDNLIEYKRASGSIAVNMMKINTSNAVKMRISTSNESLSTLHIYKLKYPTYNSLYSFQGAFDFVVNKILTFNPKARIIVIGEYENQKYPSISENQLIAADRWNLPIYKQWERLGWSQQLINVNGTYKTMLNAIIPDNLHPHTDTSGFALTAMAENIAGWLNTVH